MPSVVPGRMTAHRDAPFVVFLIGMRINRPLKLHKWLPVFAAMPRMVRELEANPKLGFLGAHSWLGRTTIMLQYWDSFEKFESYARAKDHAYLPAWRDFNRRVGTSGDVGVWHETYLVQPGGFEAIYSNMPPFGSPSLPPPSLRKAGASMRATGCAANPTRRIDGILAQHVACVSRTPHWSSASCRAGRSALCEVRCRTSDVGAEQCC